MNIQTVKELNNGVQMPILGFGTYQLPQGPVAEKSIEIAFRTGYRHLDTAAFYHNEESVGKAVRNSSINRKDIFVTTKLWNSDQGFEQTKKAFDLSLKKLDIEYIDLYLIHWPVEGLRKDSWRALEEIYEEGLCKAIGVSNYTIRHLEELLAECRIAPTVNQVEFHPFLYQKDLHEFCKANDIQLESYSPLTKGIRINDGKISEIAKKYNKSNAQIMIKWNLQHEIVVIPKSGREERIVENAEIFDFEISKEDMKKLDLLNENFRCTWDPTDIP